jgi:hypothetical protein
MRVLSKRLIHEELQTVKPPDSPGRAAFRICEKLRVPLITFAGAGGFHSLLSRARSLAEARSPWLRNVEIKSDGALSYSPQAQAELDSAAAAKAGAELVTQLLELLETFIGSALTRRVVFDVWPTAADNKRNIRKPLK